jgi:hypothetical protein
MLTFSLLIVFAQEIIPPDGRDFHHYFDRRGYRVHLRPFDVVPADRSLQQPPTLLFGDEEYFRIEAETVNPLQPEDRLRGFPSKGFESALRVFKPQACERELDPIGASPDGLAEKRLMRSDQSAIERARPEYDIIAAIGYRPYNFDDLARRGRQVGVEKESDLAIGFEHSVPHGIAFSPVPRILDQSQPGAC